MTYRSFLFVVLFLACFFSGNLSAVGGDSLTITDDTKVYISPEAIVITQEGLFVCFDELLFPVSIIGCDIQGIYCKPLGWFCPNCHRPNGGPPPCRWCGWPNSK